MGYRVITYSHSPSLAQRFCFMAKPAKTTQVSMTVGLKSSPRNCLEDGWLLSIQVIMLSRP